MRKASVRVFLRHVHADENAEPEDHDVAQRKIERDGEGVWIVDPSLHGQGENDSDQMQQKQNDKWGGHPTIHLQSLLAHGLVSDAESGAEWLAQTAHSRQRRRRREE